MIGFSPAMFSPHNDVENTQIAFIALVTAFIGTDLVNLKTDPELVELVRPQAPHERVVR